MDQDPQESGFLLRPDLPSIPIFLHIAFVFSSQRNHLPFLNSCHGVCPRLAHLPLSLSVFLPLISSRRALVASSRRLLRTLSLDVHRAADPPLSTTGIVMTPPSVVEPLYMALYETVYSLGCGRFLLVL